MICDECVKQDVCKHKKLVGKFEEGKHRFGVPEPLKMEVTCPYKVVDHRDEQ